MLKNRKGPEIQLNDLFIGSTNIYYNTILLTNENTLQDLTTSTITLLGKPNPFKKGVSTSTLDLVSKTKII